VSEEQLGGRLMRLGKTDYVRSPNGAVTGEHSNASCHFDALKFADWLKEEAPQRHNINHIDDEVTVSNKMPKLDLSPM